MTAPRQPKGWKTAAEHARLKEDMLRNDPDYRARVEAAEAERQERARQLEEAERPIVADVRAAGVPIDSVWDLINTSAPYPAALPVLMDHLERGGYPRRVMESLGRALAVKAAAVFWDRIKDRWLNARDPGEEEGAAVALAACVTRETVEDLIELLFMDERSQTRVYFIRPVLTLGGDRGREVVTTFRRDPVLGKEATALLKRRQP